MDSNATLWLLGGGLFLAWILAPIIIVQYRLFIVPKRYAEIKERFLPRSPQGQIANVGQSGVWHYARLVGSNINSANPEEVLKSQFWHFHGWDRYALPLILGTLFSGLMLAFSGLWIADRLQSAVAAAEKAGVVKTNSPAFVITNNIIYPVAGTTNLNTNIAPATGLSRTVIGNIKSPFVLALWGAFVWSLYEILSRRKSGDLTPIELYDVALRYATAVPIGYAFSLLTLETVPGFLAFAVSALPLREVLQVTRKQALQKLSATPATTSSLESKGYIGETLCGIGNDTLARLQELNIETFLDLAYTDPVRLVIKTGVPIQLALAWIDQALLAVYLVQHKAKLTQMGMPCALDVYEFYSEHCWNVATGQEKDWRNSKAVQDLAAKLEIPIEILVPQSLRSIFEDPHVRFLDSVWHGPAKPEQLSPSI